MPQRQLGELMTELGLISEEQLTTVLEVQQRSKRPIGQIIVELGFASGAAVAHALAMQSGGALRTEYGFALGVNPEHGDAGTDEATAGLPKLRLAPTAVVPPVRANLTPGEEPEAEQVDEIENAAEVAELEDTVAVTPLEVVPETEESSDAEPEDVLGEPQSSVDTPTEVADDPVELERLNGEIEQAALVEDQAAAIAEQEERLQAEAARLEATLADASAREQELTRLREEHERATNELGQLQAVLAEAQASASEQERRLAEEQERHAGDRSDLAAERDRLHDELGDALERLAAEGTAAAERERLLGDVDRLESALAAAQTAHEQELRDLREEHEHDRAELNSLRMALADAQTAAAEQERRLAEEQERHADEQNELTTQRDRIQQDLGDALERLAVVGPAAEERDALRTEVEQLRAANAETQETCAAELHRMAEERDHAMAELAEAREMLLQAERVRESQIALAAERDRAVAELEKLRTIAAEAQAANEEQTRLLAEEQDRRHEERESLVAQRTLLEQELGTAIEQLAAAGAAADERETQLQLRSQRLQEALDAVRRLAAELTPAAEELPNEEPEAAETAEDQPEAELETASPETEPLSTETESGPVDYSLFVPSPNGYELVPQTGVPPQAGETVEIVLPDRNEPTLFEVVRSGRTLPGGDVCVYLAQV
jgi:hypothetical protein